MYYYIILCSGYRTSGLATDRLTCSSHARVQDNPPAPMSRMFSNARYVSILAISSVRERAKRADPCPSLRSLRITNPPTSRMPRIVESRDQLTQARPCGNGRDRHGGIRAAASNIYLFRHFCQNSTTSVHYRA